MLVGMKARLVWVLWAIAAVAMAGPANVRSGDRLAIVGDSITEQKQYSRFIESYLLMCRPEMNVRVRQYGWSGETAPLFLARMDADCLVDKPTLVTTCYGMNDHGYREFEPAIGERYEQAMTEMVARFEAAGARVLVGSPGIVTKIPSWTTNTTPVPVMNAGLGELTAIARRLGQTRAAGFADVRAAMEAVRDAGVPKYGEALEVAGADGIHPGGAGHMAMAYAFLRELIPSGDLARFTLELESGTASTTDGHKLIDIGEGQFTFESARYPFCPPRSENPTQSAWLATEFLPFHEELNRFMLVVRGAESERLEVTWGTESLQFTRDELEAGINLAKAFPVNPFVPAFERVDRLVMIKQTYETQRMKMITRSEDYVAHPTWYEGGTRQVLETLEAAARDAFQPVRHTLRVREL